MSLFNLTLKSMFSRKSSNILLIISIALSAVLLMSVQKVKQSAKESFSQSLSGTDLIVGARSGDLQLLFYTIFHQGQAVANMSWDSFKDIQAFSEVKWVVPLSLGDSHRGYPVLGTSEAYFDHYQYARKQSLELADGAPFKRVFQAVIGAQVASKLQYQIKDRIFLSHGIAKSGLSKHGRYSFEITGILKPTGTPVDKTVHIPLSGIQAIHMKDSDIFYSSGPNGPLLKETSLNPASITGALLGLKSKFSIFSIQNRITTWASEPLMAIIPGVTLSKLWQNISSIDTAFLIISVLVIVIAFIGLLLALLLSLQQRKRELAILRVMGAHPSQLWGMLILESVLITSASVGIGLLLLVSTGPILTPIIEEKVGLIISIQNISINDLLIGLAIIIIGIMTSIIPAFLAYRKGKSQGFISV